MMRKEQRYNKEGKKLYPFSTARNQHNFQLISNKCTIIMREMECGEREFNEAEYDRLERMRDRADELFAMPLPVAWLTWEDLKDAKELSAMAINMRAEACVAKGRPDLVTYCAL